MNEDRQEPELRRAEVAGRGGDDLEECVSTPWTHIPSPAAHRGPPLSRLSLTAGAVQILVL